MSYSLAFSQSLYVMLYVGDKVEQRMLDFIPTQQIAEELNIPVSTTGLILRRLNRAGIIETREGAGGGVRLALPPEQITLLDVFDAIEREKPMFNTRISLKVTGEKPTRAQNGINAVLNGAESAMKAYLEGTTIKDLMGEINR